MDGPCGNLNSVAKMVILRDVGWRSVSNDSELRHLSSGTLVAKKEGIIKLN